MIKINSNIKLILHYLLGIFLFTSVIVIISSCSSNKYSQSDINKYFSIEMIKAKTSAISFRIPQGWHVVDANDSTFIDLWIVRDDLKVSLSLLPFHSNNKTNSLQDYFEMSLLLKKMKYSNIFSIVKEEAITLNGKETLFYNFENDKDKFRVAIFQHNNNTYELTLFGNNSNIKIEYFIQELLIITVK